MRGTARRTTRSRIGHTVVALAVGLGVTIGAGAPASADPSDASEAQAQLLSSDLIGADLADAFTARSGNPSSPAPDGGDVDASVLNSLLGVSLPGVALPLIASAGNDGLLDLSGAAGLGLLQSYSSTPTTGRSVAASGALGADGALDLDAGSDPSTIGTTKLDLTNLLGQLGVDGLTDDVVDQLGIDLGALASRAEATGVGTADRDYLLAGGRLTLHSPAVDALAAGLTARVQDVQDAANAALADGGDLDTVLDAVDIDLNVPLVARVEAGPATAQLDLDLDAAVQDLLDEPLVSDDGIASIDLGDGTISVDLAKLLKGPDATDLNGLPANTGVLTAPTIDAIGAAVADALGGLGESVGSAVSDALDGAQLTVDVPGTITVAGASNPLDITVTGTLGGFAGTPGSAAPTIDITGTGLAAVLTALRPLVNTAVVGALRPVVGTLLTTLTDGLEPGVNALVSTTTTALGPVFDTVLPQIATITINEQTDDDVLGQDSSTVRALAIDVLPGLRNIAAVNLAESTVRVSDLPTLSATPDPVYPGGTVSTSGDGWTPGTTVDLVYTDDEGTVVATTDDVPVGDDGTISDSVDLPDGVAVGDLTVTGTGSNGRTATASVQVIADPTLAATPDPVRQGGTVTVAGDGWPAGPVRLSYVDADGVRTTLPDPVTVGADGVLDATFDLPADVPLGNLVVTGTGADGADASDTIRVVAEPSVTASPDPVTYGDTVTATGQGWTPGTPVTVTFTDAGGDVVQTAAVPVADDGSFTETLDVPPGTAVGALTVAATQGRDSADDTVQVRAAPQLTAAPDPVRPGDTVTASGSGYPGGVDVTVTYTDADGTTVATQTATTQADGTFEDTLRVPAGTAAGELAIAAETAGGIGDDTSVEVVVPAITASPDPVAYGDDLAVTGTGWPAGETVTVVVTDAAGDPVGTKDVAVAGDGTFATTVPVPAGTALGAAAVTATDGAGHSADDAVQVVAAPELQASPGVVAPGDTVTAEGTGYPPNTDVTVTYTDSDGNTVATHTARTDGDGAFTDTLEVPAGTPPGALDVVGDDGDGHSATDSVTVSDPDVTTATLVAGPPNVAPGDTVTAQGDGYPPNTDVTVTYTDADGNTVATHTARTDGDGSFTDTLTVPAGTPPGELAVVGDDGDGHSATDSVTVTSAAPAADPALVASPGTVRAGDTVTAKGSGYPANTPVTVTYTDADGKTVATHTVRTDGDGAFTDTLKVPGGTPPGELAVVGDDGAGNRATDSVTVTNAAASDPTIVAGPPSVGPGDTVTVNGSGYPPNTDVTVTYTDANGNTVATHTVTTDGNGAFTDTLTVPAGTPAGPLTVVGVDGAGNRATDSVRVTAASRGNGNGGTAGGSSGASGSGAASGGSSSTTGSSGSLLPDTGSPFGANLPILAAGLLLIGAAMTLMSRRRKRG